MNLERSNRDVWIEDDEFNDETFGDSVDSIAQDFDFYGSTQGYLSRNTLNQLESQPQMHTFTESSLLQRLTISGSSPNQAVITSESKSYKNFLTLEELEQKMIQDNKLKRLKEQNQAFLLDHREFTANKKAAATKYDGLMTQSDTDYLLRIQISQLVNEESMSESFYSHMYSILKQQAQKSLQLVPGSSSAKPTEAHTNKVNHQVQRIINDARRRRPKTNTVILEGTLGKPTAKTSRTPKQVIQVAKTGSTEDIGKSGDPKNLSNTNTPIATGPTVDPYSRFISTPQTGKRKILKTVEQIYDLVLSMEQILREHQILTPEYFVNGPWLVKYNETKSEMWSKLELDSPVSSEFPHPFVRILSTDKGKRIIPRIVHHLLPDQVLAMVTTLVANYESLDVCRLDRMGLENTLAKQQSTTLYMASVMPPVMAYLSDAPLPIINGLLALLIDRNSIAWVARSKPGMVMITLLLTRAEELKQQMYNIKNGTIDQAGLDIQQQTAGNHLEFDQHSLHRYLELYNLVISSLQGQLHSLIPQINVPSIPLSQFTLSMAIEDSHVWQFLASLAIGANVEQQHILVSVVRDSIFERLQVANRAGVQPETKKLISTNLNLFLNSLGLDVSQIAV